MKNLIIIGAGGYGREAFTLAKNSIGFDQNFVIKGYLDSDVSALDKFQGYPPILDTVEEYKIEEDDVFICAIGNVAIRMKTVAEVKAKGGVFTNLIHKSAYIGDNVKLGTGIFIAYDVVISNDTTIEDYVLINSRALIGHDCKVGEYTSVGVYAFIGGGVNVGASASINANVSVRNNIVIGNNATVGMGSVAIKNVPDNATVFGNPAKKIF